MNDASDFKIIERGRGRVLLFHGYQFYRNSIISGHNSYWRCKNYKNKHIRCKGYVTITKKEDLIVKTGDHNCSSDESQNTIDETISKCITEAEKGREPAPRIYRKCLVDLRNKGLDLASCNPIPTFSQKKDTIYRRIRKHAGVHKLLSSSHSEVQVPKLFLDDLLADYFDDDIRIIIFCNSFARSQMKTIKVYFMDGTFKASPSPFAQLLFSIHGDLSSSNETNIVIPLAFAFMSHKSEKAYRIVFELCKAQIPEWDPKEIHVDYEMATIKAINCVFENATIIGCYFHYRNCLKRKATEYNLTSKKHKYIVNLCSTLALLPDHKINAGWQYIKCKEIASGDENLEKFQKYFENFWMRPDFIHIWSVFANRHRTNNIVEGWNYKINGLIKKNPTIIQILHVLHDDNTLANFKVDQYTRFGKKTLLKRSKKCIETDDFIRDAQLQLTCGDISTELFLYKVALFTSSF